MDEKQTPDSSDDPKKATQLYSEGSPGHQLEALDEARNDGMIFVWVSLGVAAIWWIASIVGTAAIAGPDRLSAASPALIVAGIAALLLPGVLIILSGFLARANSRAAATNALVLQAAARLLAPLETSSGEARTFAGLMKTSAAEVDRSMAHALSSMKAMAGEISEERQRLESVSLATSDNARDLSDRLGRERKSLETLAADIRHQTELMSEAIPRQAEQMRDSARLAANDIVEADQALEARLESLNEASAILIDRVGSLDEMSVEAAKRSQELIFSVTRMEEKLEQSRKMVDQALRAGEMAAASASTTGDRMTNAVSTALENARNTSREIQAEALEAANKAAESLAALKTAGLEATEAVRQARREVDVASPAPSDRQDEPPNELQAVAQRVDTGSTSFEPKDSAYSYSFARGPSQPKLEDDDVFDHETSATRTSEAARKEDKGTDTDLFEAPGSDQQDDKATSQPDNETDNDETSEPPVRIQSRWSDRIPPYLKPVGGTQAFQKDTGDDDGGDTDKSNEDDDRVTDPADDPRNQHWRDILADVEGHDRPTIPREENAEEVIHRLMDSGIQLNEVFRPRDKKRIAGAARKGEGLRRKAVVDTASRQVQRVQKRLDADDQLMMMAREFLTVEEPDALVALDKTSHSAKNASARLSAFLLIDAAMG